MRISVFGSGAWGTALANHAVNSGHEVVLWGRDALLLDQIQSLHRNPRYLPQILLNDQLRVEPELRGAIDFAEAGIIAVPSKGIPTIAEEMSRIWKSETPLLCVTKGIDFNSGSTMCGVLESKGIRSTISALSGPTLAEEVSLGMPSAVVVGNVDETVARFWQTTLHRQTFRVYTSVDRLGIELGGALKNIIAIAAGVSDGLGLGDNSKAALVTRAAVEIQRLGMACGAREETFNGLSGLGDLMVTCFSRLSRNRRFGERIGKGEPVADVLTSLSGVVEGYPTSKSAWSLARKNSISVPIIEQVFLILHEDKDPRQALQDLMARDSKAEKTTS